MRKWAPLFVCIAVILVVLVGSSLVNGNTHIIHCSGSDYRVQQWDVTCPSNKGLRTSP